MILTNNYYTKLYEEDFLLALYTQKNRELYARIISLDINELPIQQIEGKITGGSINVDGDSNIRRTCNLSMVTKDISIDNYYWGIETKIKLEVGLKNNLKNKYAPSSLYPEVAWVPQGIFILNSFNTSIGINNINISLSGKDKMCLLNGELGGQIFASVDFGTEEYQEKQLVKSTENFADSTSLMSNEYYYEYDNSDLTTIYASQTEYGFIPNENGAWIKIGNKYEKKNIPGKQKYSLYKLLTDPREAFEKDSIQKDENNNYILKSNPVLTSTTLDEFNTKLFSTENLSLYKIKTYKNSQKAEFNKNYYQLKKPFVESDFDNQITVYDLKDLYEIGYQYSIKQIPLEKIIREAVHTYAKEPYHNIIINDLSKYALEQLSYKGDKTLYALRETETKHFSQIFFERNLPEKIQSAINDSNFKFDTLVTEFTGDSPKATDEISIGNKTYTIAKIEYGDDVGYRITELTYNGDLISSIGETLTSVLDKIKQMLGNFEYFYDIDGRFIFQAKKNYVNTAWSQLTNNKDEKYVTYANDIENKRISFNFEGNYLISALSNTPVLSNVRNDYSVWGKRKGISGAEIPIHARYAIDKKPVRYKALSGIVYVSAAAGQEDREDGDFEVDWRELIYQMAYDYFQGAGCSADSPLFDLNGEVVLTDPDHFLYEVGRRNPKYYPTGITGYEQYYTDMEGFWRQLYNPQYVPQLVYTPGEYQETTIQDDSVYVKTKKWIDRKLSDVQVDYFFSENIYTNENINSQISEIGDNEELLKIYNKYKVDDFQKYWNIAVFEAPETLNFWIEFLDEGDELQQFSIPVIGHRSKTVNEDKASAIIFREVPDLIIVDKDKQILEDEELSEGLIAELRLEQSGYTFINIPQGYGQFFTISYRTKSVKNAVDELLYQYSYCVENISITALPIYTLQPNTRIYVCDSETKINGEYIVSKFTIPLTYNGTMSITAVKAPERLY